jgi:predicted nucleic acid-binding Zn ribbon protein
MMRRAPKRLSASLPHVLQRIGPQTDLAAAQLAWPKAAGEAIAAESEPVSERQGVVTIVCRSATWAEQLDLLQGDLLDRLRAELGGSFEVRELRFRVGEAAADGDRG